MMREQNWRSEAACINTGSHHFFPAGDDNQGPESDEAIAYARTVCSVCPVTDECFLYAIETNQRYGIWGGTTAKERRRAIRLLRRQASTVEDG
jgi:WhiB family redox-sensing transcriptional regulator